jgi:hypothetical protein
MLNCHVALDVNVGGGGNIITCMCVTIDGVWIGEWIY